MYNYEEVISSLGAFHNEDVVEIRILKTKNGTISGYYDNFETLANDIKPYNGIYNIYATINPVNRSLLSRSANHLTKYASNTTSDKDVERRTTLMIDIDPKRPAGISATDDEHKKALDKIFVIKDYLSKQGFGEPVICDSGNGGHLFYDIDLPNNKESAELVKKVLEALDLKFSDEWSEVDKTTYNAARITKLYGTIACKGDDTADRPHRQSYIIEAPEGVELVTKDQLESIANLIPSKKKINALTNKTSFDIIKWMDDYDIAVVQTKPWNDGMLYELKSCPWSEEHKDGAYIIQYPNGGISAGCHHSSCARENWGTLRDKFEPDWKDKSNPKKDKGDDKDAKKSQTDVLIEIGKEADFFVDSLGTEHVSIEVENHSEIYKLKSKLFKNWLKKHFYKKTRKAPTSEAMSIALSMFEMFAHEGGVKEISLRCAWNDGSIYYDITKKDWSVVEIKSDGWSVIPKSPVMFYRNKNVKEQLLPKESDDIDIINKHFRFVDNDGKILHFVSLCAKFIPDIANPVIIYCGVQGSSKSTSMKKDRAIVDPVVNDVVSLPKSSRDFMILMSNNFNPSFDNLDTLSREKSNMLCIACTGGSFGSRMLFTDDDEMISTIQRPISLNGINIAATQPDLLDRAIILSLDRIPDNERQEESILWKEFNDDIPKILGCIFGVISKAMVLYDSIRLKETGRLADFTKWGYAIAEAANLGGENFLQAYLRNQETANNEALDSNPISSSILQFMDDRKEWEGMMSELLKELKSICNKYEIDTRSKSWANEPNVLSRRLGELKVNLETMGIYYVISHHAKGKIIKLTNENFIPKTRDDILKRRKVTKINIHDVEECTDMSELSE